ncbi:hypothetical protein HG536_0C03580 [Torulaspora globosa]|uniref:Uncharacterized protein n=1 Tax=Torulaspora globosa TaxID=48254 RepID=A0A7G3ZFA4_9SACH|nr:uncharacterized protein HG536_0C03580 [Torulaspora globosa]QLL32190.1 hypothetical protein HG536_0C03580 [Torulaspora globosa]
MLKRTKTASNKRHSVFVDVRHSKSTQSPSDTDSSKFDIYQTKNRSLEALAEIDTTNCAKKAHSRSKLKRSSVLLDNTMVRDYNLAIRHFEKLDTRPIQSSSSDSSISSSSSTTSSLFSTDSTTSIRDLLYEGLDDTCDEDCEIVDKTHLRTKMLGDDKGRLRVDDDGSTGYGRPHRRTSLHFE